MFMPGNEIGLDPLRYPVRQYKIKHGQDYTFEAVLSDIVDNSIDAGATWVEVSVPSQTLDDSLKIPCGQTDTGIGLSGGKNLYALIIDNGKGIPESEFQGAMSEGYDRKYDESELGAFGVGLKASSLAQAYEVTVLSKVKGESEHILRLSSCLVNKYGKEKIWRVEDFDPWMKQSRGFLKAEKALKELDHGTVVLLEGLHQLELDIGEDRDRSWYINQIKNRIKNYLGLVFHYYIQGTAVPRVNGKPIRKKIELYYNGRDTSNEVLALDPFGQQWYNGSKGDSKGTLCIPQKFPINFGVKQRDIEAKLWILPHKKSREGRTHMQNRMKMVRKKAGIAELQGVYIYRNRRLVEFSPPGDIWKGMLTPDSHYNYARCEIHLPPCIPGEGQEFSVNTSKTEVDLGRTIEERLKKWSDKPQSKWHSKDPIKTSLSKRAQLRLGEDKGWKKCTYCEENSLPGADTHKFADCPHRPTCGFCGKKSHGGKGVPLTREYCPKVKPCGKCGSKAHDTSNHVDVPIIIPVPEPGPTPTPSPNPDPPLTSTFPVSYTNKGPLISSKDSESGGLPILNINQNHPNYATLKELLGA